MTPLQQRFLTEYLIDLNATQAAIRAGYSEKTAYSQGQRLLKKAEMQEALKTALETGRRRNEVTVDGLTAELDEARLMALEKGNPSATISAIMAKAKLHGLDVIRHKVSAETNIQRIERVLIRSDPADG